MGTGAEPAQSQAHEGMHVTLGRGIPEDSLASKVSYGDHLNTASASPKINRRPRHEEGKKGGPRSGVYLYYLRRYTRDGVESMCRRLEPYIVLPPFFIFYRDETSDKG